MKINCLCCGHSLELGDAYEDFDGKVRCFVCGGGLNIRTEDGSLKAIDDADIPNVHPSEQTHEPLP